jgi:hypothetical protein
MSPEELQCFGRTFQIRLLPSLAKALATADPVEANFRIWFRPFRGLKLARFTVKK